MRLVIQRVTRARVSWPGPDGSEAFSAIGRGLVILVGAAPADTEAAVAKLAGKVALLRIFAGAAGRTDLGLLDVGGEALVVSQFTLFADAGRGRRPGFTGAADPELARSLCELFAQSLAEHGVPTRSGSFGAPMVVSLDNEGPFTLVLSSDPWHPAGSG